jgi:hypothetical protein
MSISIVNLREIPGINPDDMPKAGKYQQPNANRTL